MEKTLATGEGDMDYWEAVLRRLRIQKVRCVVCGVRHMDARILKVGCGVCEVQYMDAVGLHVRRSLGGCAEAAQDTKGGCGVVCVLCVVRDRMHESMRSRHAEACLWCGVTHACSEVRVP